MGFLFYLSPDRDTLRSPFSCGDGIDRLLSWKNSAMRYLAFAGMFLVCAAPCAAAVITLGASADAFVATGPANELAGLNYGDASSLMVAGANGGQGVFKTVVRFNTSNVKAQFDAQLGAGAWGITSVTIRHGSNAGAAGIRPNNLMFPVIRAGDFNISWMADDSWEEGIGFPLKPTTDGVTFHSLDAFLSPADRPLGRFTWDAPGNNIRRTWTLAPDPALLADLINPAGTGARTSFVYTPADDDIAFLFNARSYSNSANRPLLTITAEVPEPAAGVLLMPILLLHRRPRRGKADNSTNATTAPAGSGTDVPSPAPRATSEGRLWPKLAASNVKSSRFTMPL
ncbi:MAG TPA: hypothetical protein PLD59_14495 [Tepidisphaeraceae bacterium]|nr:hypothetical protein [Tepidisphaeraceae bacterium]